MQGKNTYVDPMEVRFRQILLHHSTIYYFSLSIPDDHMMGMLCDHMIGMLCDHMMGMLCIIPVFEIRLSNLLARKLQNENIYIDSIEKNWQKSLVRINFHWP
jgi:hypothetical protein